MYNLETRKGMNDECYNSNNLGFRLTWMEQRFHSHLEFSHI